MRTTPCARGQMPSTARARELFPAALGPISAHISPAFSSKLTPIKLGAFAPGGTRVTASQAIAPCGFGRLSLSRSTGKSAKNLSRRS